MFREHDDAKAEMPGMLRIVLRAAAARVERLTKDLLQLVTFGNEFDLLRKARDARVGFRRSGHAVTKAIRPSGAILDESPVANPLTRSPRSTGRTNQFSACSTLKRFGGSGPGSLTDYFNKGATTGFQIA